MRMIQCVIADDEPIAREIVQNYCAQIPYLEVISSCGTAMEAKIVLQSRKTDILFLDINMPVIDGVSLLKTLKDPPQVIFTTAYKEYAIDAFDLSACDYLLKPFSLERFIMAVDKAMERLNNRSEPDTDAMESDRENYVFLKSDGKIHKVGFDELLYAEASGNYTRLVMKDHVLVPGMSFLSVEELLPASRFLRVHRSFIINKSWIGHIEGNRVFVNGKEIPIGTHYKESFFRSLGLSA